MSNLFKGVLAVGTVGVAATVVWFFAISGVEPTTGVTAPPIETTTTAATSATSTTVSAEDGAGAAEANDSERLLLQIGEGSTATFELDEELRGQPTHVVGVSDMVLGEISLDPRELANTEIGTVLVNARAFRTDSNLRDRAVNGPILDTGAFEFIEFTPIGIRGLSGPAEVGQTVEFQVTGDLTIRDVTHEVTFDVVAVLSEGERVEGVASATVLRSDFGLQIPNVASVANVTDEVLLTLDFVALPA